MESKGEVSNDRKEKQDILQNNFEKLLSSAQVMSDLLNEPLPDLPKDEQIQGGGVVMDMSEESADTQLDPWGDEETKSFYIDLPDLRVFLPNYAPKIQPVQAEEETAEVTEEVLDMEIQPEQLEVDDPAALAEEFTKTNTPEPVAPEEAPAPTTGPTASQPSGHATRQQFEVFLHNLANCVNKELIDSAAIEFLLSLNTKNNRKKLTSALFGVQRLVTIVR